MIIGIIGTFISFIFLFFFISKVGTPFGGLMILVLTIIIQLTFFVLDNHFIESRRNSSEARK